MSFPLFMFFSRLQVFYKLVVSFVSALGVYGFSLFCLFISFFCLRVPYVYGMGGFLVVLVFFMIPLFVSLLFCRLSEYGLASFLCEFIPSGTPLWISPFVCLAETLSYLVRPFILVIRPFVKLTMGALGGVSLGGMCFVFGEWVCFFLVLLFFYEIFVALVHWFIVCNILSFSKEH